MTNRKATWIWYPGDFEVWLGNIFNNRRTERGAMFPPFWKQDSHYPTVEFTTTVKLKKDENITITAEGQYNLAVDGKLQRHASIPKGQHRISIKVWNQATPPALYVSGPTIHTDATWQTTYEDKIWIDENGVAHGSGIYVPVGSWNFDDPKVPPSQYRLERRELHPISKERIDNFRVLYDFGKEVFGYLRLSNQEGSLDIYYGESREEALDWKHCETLDRLGPGHREPDSKAFRYVCVECIDNIGAWYDDVWMEFEYAPIPNGKPSGTFRCSDPLLNQIWDTSAYTLDLTTREFFMDGIKRDRWTWSGDAIQSYLMNYYLRFDTECVKRTIRQLRGKDPVTAHVNTIMDYTFYWFKSILDYYEYTGDVAFVREMWPRMVTLMNYCIERTNLDGLMEGQADDWIFVDWVDFPMHKRGTLCFEQILFVEALHTMAVCARLADDEDGSYYEMEANRTMEKVKQLFWSPEAHAYLHALEDGWLNPQVTKFPNMFAILYGLATPDEQRDIMQHVMLNPAIPPITTPYMRFYELETLCLADLHTQVLQEMRAYWGGMLREGATTFWEKYNPEETGTQHLAMYGRPYGKSLCHAWGASPLYLLGRYYLGVRPVKPGYEEFEVRPALGDLDWMEGDVPTPHGPIHVRMDRRQVTVRATGGHGWLIVGDQRVKVKPHQDVIVRL